MPYKLYWGRPHRDRIHATARFMSIEKVGGEREDALTRRDFISLFKATPISRS